MNDIEIDIRGGLPASAPLELTGEFTGYNTAATMQVGLWIRNDSEHIGAARNYAQDYGPVALGRRLLQVMANAWYNLPGTAPGQVYDLFQQGELERADIDWAQIAFDLIGSDPTERDLEVARDDLNDKKSWMPPWATDDEVWRHAADMRSARMRRWVLEGVR